MKDSDITDEMVKREREKASKFVPLTDAEVERLKEWRKNIPTSRRQRLIMSFMIGRPGGERAPPVAHVTQESRGAYSSANEVGVEPMGARERVERLKRLPSEEVMMRAARESMARLALSHGPEGMLAAWNVQGCCGSCVHREACFGDRQVQLNHCIEMGESGARLRCFEHQEKVRVKAAPRDVCGGPRHCPMYASVLKGVDVKMDVGR